MQATEAMTEQLWFVIQFMHKVWDRLNMDRFLGKQQAKEEAMKVQAKLLSDHYQYEVVEESSNYYIVYGTGGKVAVSKADYEPVQEWVDVTHECTITNKGSRQMIMHGTYELRNCAAVACSNAYRLKATGSHGIRVERKVKR